MSYAVERPVSARLAIAIFLVPWAFAWFTLRDGYSTLARVVSFIYMGIILLLGILSFVSTASAVAESERALKAIDASAAPVTNVQPVVQPAASQIATPTPEQALPTPATTMQQTSSSPVGKPLAAAMAAQISADYEANEVAAQMKYSPYRLQITGVVDRITLDYSDKPVIHFVGSTIMNGAMASIASGYEQRAAGISKGMQLTVVCESISEIAGSPTLQSCAF